jgi:outer membrane scaffolding protein for murein synthesis (MipA/OmpV family)
MFIKIINLLNIKLCYSLLLALLYLALTTISYAKQEHNITSSSANAPIVKDEFDWQFVVDLSLVDTQVLLADVKQTEPWHYFQLGLLLDMSYKGFFIQTNSRRSSTLLGSAEMGYQITVQNNWQIDVILKAYLEGYDPAEIIDDQEKSIPQLAGLTERDYTSGIALRYSHFYKNALFYIDLAAARTGEDEQGDDINGLIIDSFYSYLLPYRNWDIYFNAGLTYYDQALVDYYIGVNANEVTSSRPLYEADGGFRAQLEVYAQYPLSQSWSFNAGITQSFYSHDVKNSPLVDKSKLTQFMVGVLYVF